MKVGLLGDCHSNFPWIHYAIDYFHRNGIITVLQVGDLGVWPGKKYARGWDKVQEHLEEVGQLWLVTPGNHEDYTQINSIPPDEDTGWLPFRDRIVLLPRGARWEMGNLSFVSLGGANSVDRSWRQEMQRRAGYKSWWPEESITEQDVANAVLEGYADVMIAHDAPNGISTITKNIEGNPFGFNPIDILYANDGRAMMDKAFKAIAPSTFIHGHYHFPVNETILVERDGQMANCRVLGLNKDEENFSIGMLDTETGASELVDLRNDYVMHRHPSRY